MIDNNQHRKCVRAISVFVYYGQHVILQHIIDQMMIQKGNTDDLFQTFCNIKQQSGQEMNEDDTWTKEDSSEYGDTTDKTTEIRIKEKIYFNNVDTDIDVMNNDQIPDSNSDIDIHSEQRTVEQYYLLCLSCRSGDVNTVKILLKYVTKLS